MDAANYIPALKYGAKIYPQNLIDVSIPVEDGNIWFVDGDKTTGGGGKTWEDAFSESDFDGTLSSLSSSIQAGDVFYIANRTNAQTDTDPVSYTTNLTIDVPQVSLIGVSRGRTQGGLPQFKVGATTTQAIIRVRAPGVQIANLGFNGAGATGGGVRFDDDGGTTYSSFGGSILDCHFKNCKGTTATDALTGGAIMLSGAPWQMRFAGNRFYKNVGDICLLDTSTSVPQDVVIEYNSFGDSGASTDCNIQLSGGSGPGVGLLIRGNDFGTQPALSSGATALFMDLAGADGGVVAGNYFGTDGTLGATGNAAVVPTTVFLSGNYDEGGLIART